MRGLFLSLNHFRYVGGGGEGRSVFVFFVFVEFGNRCFGNSVVLRDRVLETTKMISS